MRISLWFCLDTKMFTVYLKKQILQWFSRRVFFLLSTDFFFADASLWLNMLVCMTLFTCSCCRCQVVLLLTTCRSGFGCQMFFFCMLCKSVESHCSVAKHLNMAILAWEWFNQLNLKDFSAQLSLLDESVIRSPHTCGCVSAHSECKWLLVVELVRLGQWAAMLLFRMTLRTVDKILALPSSTVPLDHFLHPLLVLALLLFLFYFVYLNKQWKK